MKKYIYIFLSVTALCLSFTSAKAQETSLFTQYYLNPYFFNPSFAGSHGYGIAHLIYRNQWAGFEGAPETFMGTWQMPVTETMGLGARIYRDNTGIFRRTGGQASYAFGVKFSENSHLRFGLSAGVENNNIDFSQLSFADQMDPALYTFDNSWAVDGSFGVHYVNGNLTVGFAMPQLLKRNVTVESDNSLFAYANHTVTSLAYRVDFGGNMSLEPLVLFKIGSYGNYQIDGTLIAKYDNRFWGGFMYRTEYGFAVTAGASWKNFDFGYAYEVAQGDLGAYSNGSHEIVLAYHLGRNIDEEDEMTEPAEPDSTTTDDLYTENETEESDSTSIADAGETSETGDEGEVTETEEAIADGSESETEVDTGDREAFTLNPAYQPAEGVKKFTPEPGKVFFLHELSFPSGSAEIGNGLIAHLENMASFLELHPEVKIEVSGHTDNTGTADGNQRLSEQRAKAVKDFLVKKGISESRIQAVGYGQTRPIATNDQEEEGRELNRRIEMKILK